MKNTPSKDEIYEQLNRILSCDSFKTGSRISSFLSYIVDKSIKGEDEKIKGYTIGVEVFDKPEDFNPDLDSSVRVEATRLRKALALYYYELGKDDPVVIKIPKGSYKPKFHYSAAESDTPENHPAPISTDKRKPGIYKTISLSIVACIILLPILDVISGHRLHLMLPSNLSLNSHENTLPPRPILAVLPLVSIGGTNSKNFAEELTHKLVKALTPFQFIRTLNVEDLSGDKYKTGRSSELTNEFGAHYVLEGTIRERHDTINLNLRVLSIQKGTYIWSFRKEYTVPFEKTADIQDEIASIVAAHLTLPYGVIQTLELERLSSIDKKAAKSQKCLLDFYSYTNNKTAEGHAKARDCLEGVVKIYPKYSEAWAYLSWIYGDESRYGFNQKRKGETAENRSIYAATKALEADNRNPHAHQYIANAASLVGNEKQAQNHLRIALSLNPNDPEILADVAWKLGQSGEWEKSRVYAEKAMELNPEHPRWYHGILFACYYHKGEYEKALTHALGSYQPDSLISLISMTTSYTGLQQYDDANKMAQEIIKKHPDFVKDPRPVFNAWNFREEFNEKLIIGLEAAGIEFEKSYP